MPRALDGQRQVALMAGTGTGLAARADLAALADEAAQLLGRFVIDLLRLLDAELADLGTRRELAARSTPFGARAARTATVRTTLARLPTRLSGRSGGCGRSWRGRRRRCLRLFLIRHDIYPS